MRDITDAVKQETLYALANHLCNYYKDEGLLGETVVRYMQEDVEEYSKSIGMDIRMLERDNGKRFVLMHESGSKGVLSSEFYVCK
jgi:hypothetical protein